MRGLIDSQNVPGAPTVFLDRAAVAGQAWFVDSGVAQSGGASPDTAVGTIAEAVALASANNGDVIFVLPGHAETVTSPIALSKAGVRVVGIGDGAARPTITPSGTIDGIDVTGANCLIENLYFAENGTSGATSDINVAAANLTIRGCRFDLGANDKECITVAADGDGLVVEDCTFLVTADGPDAAIEIEAAGCDNVEIRRNLFHGGSAANAWDAAAINSSVAHTNARIYRNRFVHGIAMDAATSVSTSAWDNDYGVACRPSADSPLTLWAADGRTTVGDGTPDDPTTIVDAVDRCSAAGDVVRLLPGTYTVTTPLAMDVAGMTLEAATYGTVELANDTDDVNTIDVTAAKCAIRGIHFTKGVANTTDGTELVDVDADGCVIERCTFDLEARANADAINLATGTKLHVIRDNVFTDGANAKSYIAWACSAATIERNLFDCSAADLFVSEQLASPGDGNFIHRNRSVSDGANGALFSWQASPGKQYVCENRLVGTAGDADAMGDDSDLDPYLNDNWRDGATTGAATVVNPSVS